MGVYCGQEESAEESSSDSESSTGTKSVKKSSRGDSASSRGGDRSGQRHHKHRTRSGRSDRKNSGSSTSRSSSRSDKSGEETDKRKSHRYVDSSGSKSGEEKSRSRKTSGSSKKKEESEKKEPGQVTTIQSIYIPSPSVVRKNQSKQALLDSALEAEMKKLRRKSDSSAMLNGGKKRTTPTSNDLSKQKNADSRSNLKRSTSVSSLSSLFENKEYSSIESSKSSKMHSSSDGASESDKKKKKSDGNDSNKAVAKASSHRPKLKRTHTTDSVSPSPEVPNRSASLDRSTTANDHQSLQALLTSFQRASELAEILEIYDLLKASCGVKKRTENSTEKIKQGTKLAAFWIKQMWTNFEKKGAQEVYKVPALQSKAKKERVLIIGGGPAGLACAIECCFLGFEVCVLEKRNYIERNNILHLWPWSMHYLSTMNAKTFYPKFGTGGIDHIGTKQLQRMMVKICLLLGITIKWGYEFQGVSASQSNPGTWEAKSDPALKDFNFNILIGADGERSRVVQEFNFERKSFKGSLSIGVTVNFENKMTSEEVCLREFGVSKIFEQKLFNDLAKKNIDLENLVYYRGETHYFVMTAKREGLIDSGVFKEVHSDVESLIATKNVNYKNMQKYLTTVASTVGVPAENEIVLNPQTQKLDIQIFDFSERLMAEEAAKLIPNPNKGASNGGVLNGQLLVSLVGDSLIQPFWPLGTGCNRAFLSAMDCAWMIRCIYLGESIPTCIENRNGSYSKMKNILNGAIAQPYTNTTIDPLSRYGTSATFQGL